MLRRLLLALSWLAFAATLGLAAMGAVMVVNAVPDAAGGAGALWAIAAVVAAVGVGLRFVGGRP